MIKIVEVMGVDCEVVFKMVESVEKYCEGLRLVDDEEDEGMNGEEWFCGWNSKDWMMYGYYDSEYFGWVKVYEEGDEKLVWMEKEEIWKVCDED
jgi:hypothetical protein